MQHAAESAQQMMERKHQQLLDIADPLLTVQGRGAAGPGHQPAAQCRKFSPEVRASTWQRAEADRWC
jgi:hypothetical protein